MTPEQRLAAAIRAEIGWPCHPLVVHHLLESPDEQTRRDVVAILERHPLEDLCPN